MVKRGNSGNSKALCLSDDALADVYLKRVDRTLNGKDIESIVKMGYCLSSPGMIARAIGLVEADLYSDENRAAFEGVFFKARALGMIAIQQAQFDVAINDRSVPLLIHLGKAYLGQNETINVNQNTTIDVKEMTLSEMIKKLAEEES